MAKEKKIEIPEILTKEQEKQLQKMVNDMLDIAGNVIDEYKEVSDGDGIEIDYSDLLTLSGSLTQIHEDSPFLDELLKGESWKRVIKNIPSIPKDPKEDKDNDTE